MPYFRKQSRRKFGILSPTSLGVIFFILFLIFLRFVFPGALTTLATPLWRLGTALDTATGGLMAGFGNAAKLSAERDHLTSENAALEAENAVLTARSEDLQKLLGTRTDPTKGVVAGVLVRPPVSSYDTLVVDQGTLSGVRTGGLALGPNGVPIGTVSSASSAAARIELFSAPARESAAWAGEARTPLTLVGNGGGTFTATLPRDSAVAAGDSLYLAGGGAIPMGTIVKVNSDPSSPRETLLIRPFTNIFSITWVQVMPALELP